jgi:N-sulfoglucosamine sulfohydrolase
MRALIFIIIISVNGNLFASDKPNILFCLADDWGWPHAGAYGDKVVKTPTFDRLADEGILFEHAYVSSPSCTPCRNSILTGQQFYRLGEGANLASTLDIKHPNFMYLLQDAGYQIGHWRKSWGPGDYVPGGYTGHPCGTESTFVEFMNNKDADKPFCFWFGTSDPHRKYDKGSGEKSGMDITKIEVPSFFPDKEEVRSDIADYYYEVQRWDSDVAKAIKLLQEKGELDNTIIVMSGDHGMPFPRCKANLYEWGVHVPLAIRWGERVNPNRKVSDFISLTDLAPTFLEVAETKVPEEMTGNSLLPFLKPKSNIGEDNNREYIVFGRERHVLAQKSPSKQGYPARAIRTNEWLLIMNLEPDRWPSGVPEGGTTDFGNTGMWTMFGDIGPGPTKSVIMGLKDDAQMGKFYDWCFSKRPALELYNCANDPFQLTNLADRFEYAKVLDTLKKQLISYLKTTDDPRFTNGEVLFDTYPERRPRKALK